MSYRDIPPYLPPESLIKGDDRCHECGGQRVVYYAFRGFSECRKCNGTGRQSVALAIQACAEQKAL